MLSTTATMQPSKRSSAFVPNLPSSKVSSSDLPKTSNVTSNTLLTVINPIIRSDTKPSNTQLHQAFLTPESATSSSLHIDKHDEKTSSAPILMTQLQPAFLSDTPFPKAPPVPPPQKKALVWFRSDLRTHDHVALFKAIEDHYTASTVTDDNNDNLNQAIADTQASTNPSSQPQAQAQKNAVIPFFCFEDSMFALQSSNPGFSRLGYIRAKFLVEAVQDLRTQLTKKNSGLVVRTGDTKQAILKMCQESGASIVYYHKGITLSDIILEEQLTDLLKQNNIHTKAFISNTLYEEGDLPCNPESTLPNDYSAFRELLKRNLVKVRPALKLNMQQNSDAAASSFPPLSKNIDLGDIPTLQQLGYNNPPNLSIQPSAIQQLTGGEVHALRILKLYATKVHQVINHKNMQISLISEFQQKLSPYLALGCISPRMVYAAVYGKQAIPDSNNQATISSHTYYELVWRDYHRFSTYKWSRARWLSQKFDSTHPKHATPSSLQSYAAASVV